MALNTMYTKISKIVIDNNQVLEQVQYCNYLGCYLTYEDVKYMGINMNSFQIIYGRISRKKAHMETQSRFYNVMAVLAL